MAEDRTIFFPYCIKTQEIQQFLSLSLKILSKIMIKLQRGVSGNQEPFILFTILLGGLININSL